MPALRRRLAALAGLVAVAAATPALAEWRRAESPHFVVYSEGSERGLRDYVRDLEYYDYFLRDRFKIPARETERKLPIYLVSRNGLERVRPGIGEAIAGIYLTSSEDIFAIAEREHGEDVLLHEYFHHISIQSGATASFPSWLIEGLAEYYSTAEIRTGTIEIGQYDRNTELLLAQLDWIPLDDLLTKRIWQIQRREHHATYYPVAWLLTHWMLSDPARTPQLLAYVRDLERGAPSVEAMERATGMSIAELTRQLKSYRRVTSVQFSITPPEAPITVTTLSQAEGDLLLLGQRLKIGVAKDAYPETLEEVRRAAARHPSDPTARLVLGHAEVHGGDEARGEVLLLEVLEADPDNVEALQWLASMHIDQASEGSDGARDQILAARGYLARAYSADPHNFHTLDMLAQTRQGAADYPTENDLETWRQAFLLAPQLPHLRLGYSSALMQAGRNVEATLLLRPLANAPHGGASAQAAQQMLARAASGGPPLDQQTLDAATDADETDPPEPPSGTGEAGRDAESAPQG